MSEVQLSCACGTLKGKLLRVKPGSVAHLVCYCDDCQTYAAHLEQIRPENAPVVNILDDWGGTEVFQTTPKRVQITEGHAHLACVRQSPKGLMRWYASCCGCPVANTLANAKIPFAGIVHAFVDDKNLAGSRDAVFGPIEGRVNCRFARGQVPNGHPGAPVSILLKAGMGILTRWIAGEATPSPFFTKNTPSVTPTVLTREERKKLQDSLKG